jgi:hypothetical protein
METKNDIVEQRLKESARDSKVSCALARKIAEDLDVPYKVVGETANRLKIKIKNCDLGCF